MVDYITHVVVRVLYFVSIATTIDLLRNMIELKFTKKNQAVDLFIHEKVSFVWHSIVDVG